MKTILLLIILALQLFAVYYLVRTARTLGSKSTQHHNALMANLNLLKEKDFTFFVSISNSQLPI